MQTGSPEQRAAAHLAAGRPQAALEAIEAAARAPGASHTVLSRHAAALKALGRLDDCLAVRRLAAERFADSGIAWHNLASALGDSGAHDEALEACRRAFAAGLDAAETRLIQARALVGAGRAEEALAAFEEALRRRPDYGEALTEKARLIWAAYGDLDRAVAVLPRHPAHALAIAELCKSAGAPARAVAAVEAAAAAAPGAAPLQQALAGLALEQGDVARAGEAAAAALRLAPRDPVSQQAWAAVCLAQGRAGEALTIARRLAGNQPANTSAVALQAVAARLAGAEDYGRLHDYDAFVQTFDIDPPEGWASTAAFLVDLRGALDALHAASLQPLEQSLRHGTQTANDLRSSDHPAVKGFFAAIDPPIRRYMARIGAGDDPLRARNSGDYALVGAWSIQLRSQGFHVDHMHPAGWLSSAFYVDVPPEVGAGEDHAGWLQFGRPSLRTTPALEPDHFVRPVPGRLVLFPSYMWHGTAPFTSAQHRTTIAFDVAPA